MPRALTLLLLLALQATATPARAADARPDPDEVEETEVTPIAGSPAAGGGSAIPPPRIELKLLLGRLHPIFVHLPIGWLTLLVLLELAALVRRRDAIDGIRLALLALTATSCVPAVLSGLLRADEITRQAPDSAALATLHRNLMLALSGASLLALGIRLQRGRDRLVGLPRALYLAVLLAASALLVYGAHLGGKLAFGERYLPF
jgi:uncharacterized membrane protein